MPLPKMDFETSITQAVGLDSRWNPGIPPGEGFAG
jgi:hypothetical protein